MNDSTIKLSQHSLTEYRLTAGIWIMIIGYFIEYTRASDYTILVMNIFILIAKFFDTLDLFDKKAVSDPSVKFKGNIYDLAE